MAGAQEQALARVFRGHFGHREHLYGVLLDDLADDLVAGGPTAQICRDVLDAPREDAVQLRLLAGIFRLVLRGEAPQLEPFYPCLGGTAAPEGMWPLLRPVLAEAAETLHDDLALAPQTNEVGRSVGLLVGLAAAVRSYGLSRVRLLEPGASAGLNLNVDRYRFTGPGWADGPVDSPLVLDSEAAGVEPVPYEVVERRGCDLSPVDAATPEGALWLTSFVWPFNTERHVRLAAALEVVREHPVAVDAAPAETWLAERLAEPVEPGVLTVVWQSITQQYWPAATSEQVAASIAGARERIPLAHVSMEGVPPVQGTDGYDVAVHGPELRLDGELLGRLHHHGPPLVLTGS